MLNPLGRRCAAQHRCAWLIGILAVLTVQVPLIVHAQAVVPNAAVPLVEPAVLPSILLPRPTRPMPPQRAWVPGDRAVNVATMTAEFEALCDRVLAVSGVPAMGAALVKDGKVLSVRGIGVTGASARQPAGADTVFRVAS
ncbi:MAG: hypothetical protein ABIP49_08860, partial [Lysobacterales bacterium]